MNKAGPIFILAVVGLILISVAAFYAGGSPVWGGGIGAALGAGAGVAYNKRPLSQQAGPR